MICRACKRELPPTEFNRDKSALDGKRKQCRECQATQKRAWDKENKRQRLEYNRQYCADHPEAKARWNTKYRQNHSDYFSAYFRNYRNANKAKLQKRDRKYYLLHQNTVKDRARAWVESNPLRARLTNRSKQARRRAQILASTGSHTAEDIKLLYVSQNGLCWWCGKVVDEYHVDHRIPLVKGGSNAPENLCISCPTCNLSKGAKLPQEWNGRLL